MLSCVCLFATPWTVACQAPFVHGIFYAGILERVAISYSRGSSPPTSLCFLHWQADSLLLHHLGSSDRILNNIKLITNNKLLVLIQFNNSIGVVYISNSLFVQDTLWKYLWTKSVVLEQSSLPTISKMEERRNRWFKTGKTWKTIEMKGRAHGGSLCWLLYFYWKCAQQKVKRNVQGYPNKDGSRWK